MSANLANVWVAILEQPLPVAEASEWVITPSCGAVVSFVGTVRDHAEGRPGVTSLDYEAYAEAAVARMRDIATAARERWPSVGRVAGLHRVGHLEVGDPAVVVAVSAAHRHEAFAAAEWVIDTIKESVPIWKKETWAGGSDWGTDARSMTVVR